MAHLKTLHHRLSDGDIQRRSAYAGLTIADEFVEHRD